MAMLVNPAGSAQQRIIEVQRPYLDEVDLYISGGAEILHYRGGAARPVSIRPLPARASVFPVHVPAGQSRSRFLRVQSTSPLDVYVSQWTQAEYTSHNHLEIILQSAMHGMAIVMLVLTGLAWWFGRWRTSAPPAGRHRAARAGAGGGSAAADA